MEEPNKKPVALEEKGQISVKKSPKHSLSGSGSGKDRAEAAQQKQLERMKKGFNLKAAARRSHRQCRRVVWKHKVHQKWKSKAIHLYYKIHEFPLLAQLTNNLYMLGFWTEYVLLQGYRMAERLLGFVWREAALLLQRLIFPVLRGIEGITAEITAPFRRLALGLHNIRAEQLAARAQGEKKNVKEHFIQGVIRYAPLGKRTLVYVIPAAAFVLFGFTVRSLLGTSFILGVEVNGQTIGYVQNQQDFEGAKEEVSARIDSAKEGLLATGSTVSDEEWTIDLSFHLATEGTQDGDLMTQNAMTDAILRASSDQIQNGVAVYVDGDLAGILTEEDNQKLTEYMDQLKAEAEESPTFQQLKTDPDVSDAYVAFVHTIDHGEEQSGVYFNSSIVDYDEMISLLEDTTRYYRVQSWDTLDTIAATNGITVEELCSLNGFGPDHEPVTGENLEVGQESGALELVECATVTWQEPIPYETESRSNDDMDYGKSRTIQEGQEGVREYVAEITYVDGVETGRQIISDQVLIQPVTAIVERGTKLPSGMLAAYGGGNWLWPVPAYTYVSRWMQPDHTGTDICAAYGSDVMACESGVVVTATSHWSYGNYVIIDHGNGWQTLYAHASQLYVKVGDVVSRGQVIMAVGSTGISTGNHCHLEFRYNGTIISAKNIFGSAPAK